MKPTHLITTSAAVQVAASPAEAPTYDGNTKMLKITKFIVVKKGTTGGNATVDIQMVDGDGNQHLVLVTGKILEAVTSLIAN